MYTRVCLPEIVYHKNVGSPVNKAAPFFI
jgi:hypothetical protein